LPSVGFAEGVDLDVTAVVDVVINVAASMYMDAKIHDDRLFIILLLSRFYLANVQPPPAMGGTASRI
jgi:hypothetical protein